MSSNFPRWLGDIAYALYLGHRPLLIVATAALNLATPPWWLGITIIAFSLVLADLTHRFVERQLRQHGKRPLAEDMPVNRALATVKHRAGKMRVLGGGLVPICCEALTVVLALWDRIVF